MRGIPSAQLIRKHSPFYVHKSRTHTIAPHSNRSTFVVPVWSETRSRFAPSRPSKCVSVALCTNRNVRLCWHSRGPYSLCLLQRWTTGTTQIDCKRLLAAFWWSSRFVIILRRPPHQNTRYINTATLWNAKFSYLYEYQIWNTWIQLIIARIIDRSDALVFLSLLRHFHFFWSHLVCIPNRLAWRKKNVSTKLITRINTSLAEKFDVLIARSILNQQRDCKQISNIFRSFRTRFCDFSRFWSKHHNYKSNALRTTFNRLNAEWNMIDIKWSRHRLWLELTILVNSINESTHRLQYVGHCGPHSRCTSVLFAYWVF